MLSINGQPLAHRPGLTIGELLRLRFPEWRGVVVKVDGSLVPRAEYGRRELSEGAQIEVIRMVSGG